MKYLTKSLSFDFRLRKIAVFVLILSVVFLLPQLGFCSVEGSLNNIQNKLMTVILPIAAILGLIVAGLSFVSGSQNARQHLILAMMGAAIGFGAPSIVAFIRGLVD